MQSVKIKDPFVFGEWFDIFWFHSCFISGQAQTIRKYLGYGLSQVVAEQEGNVLRIYFSRSEWSSLGRRYLNDVIKQPQLLEKLLKDLRVASDDLIDFVKELKLIDLKNADVKQQIELLEKYHDKHHRAWAIGQVPNVLELENTFFADYLKNWLAKKVSQPEILPIFQILSSPRELSMAQKEEREMLRLADQANPGQALTDHWKKYNWLQFGWIGPSLTKEYFVAVHEGLYKQGGALKKLRKLEGEDKISILKREQFIRDLAIPASVQKLFNLLEELLFLKAHRMDALFMSYEAIQPLLMKIAKEHFLSLGQVYCLYPDWLIKMLEKNKFDVDKINAISQYSVRYFDGKKIYLLIGEKGRMLANIVKEKLPKIEALSELKGECAFPGQAVGLVKIVNRAEEIKKFEEGDILVSNNTDPSLLPAMKKAAAFVTNAGGLTCHAAIVARELKIPCVIGTKIATRIFKDGDKVRVDATGGVVKKI